MSRPTYASPWQWAFAYLFTRAVLAIGSTISVIFQIALWLAIIIAATLALYPAPN